MQLPEIDPEVRGLLEEIVADPRSSIRLVPRKPLKAWFDSGERLRARDMSGTKAERHLVAAHREALAQLLSDAAWVAIWKNPVLAHKPTEADGKPYDPAGLESSVAHRAARRRNARIPLEGVDLLQQCISGLDPADAQDLARSSLGLVPNDRARFYVAVSTPWSRPRTAIYLFRRLSARASPELRPDVLQDLGARLCAIDSWPEARAKYQESCDLSPTSLPGRLCTFNLSCFLGDASAAVHEGLRLGKLVEGAEWRLLEGGTLLRIWARGRADAELALARQTASSIRSRIPDTLHVLFEAYET